MFSKVGLEDRVSNTPSPHLSGESDGLVSRCTGRRGRRGISVGGYTGRDPDNGDGGETWNVVRWGGSGVSEYL